MLHCKIRITLASEVFHKKILCFAKASEVFEGIVIFLLNVPHVFWYFQTQKEKVIDTVCLTSPCYNQLCRIISSIKMDCVCNICSKRFPNQEKLGLHQYRIHSDKPFQCKLCGEKGNGANQYSNHMRKHKEPKSIQCEICQYESTDASNMKKTQFSWKIGESLKVNSKLLWALWKKFCEKGKLWTPHESAFEKESWIIRLRFCFFECFFWFFLYEITLSAIDVDNIGCLEPFLPL